MRRALAILSAVLLLVSGTSAQTTAHKATVYTIDGQKLIGTIDEESFEIRTSYGNMKVPTKEIEALYVGSRVGEATEKRIETLVGRLKTADRDSAARDLKRMGRIVVPYLQTAAASEDKTLAKEADTILKEIWPSGAKVPSDGSCLLRTKNMDLRGTLLFSSVRVEGSFGKKTLLKPAIRLIQLTSAKVQPADDPPDYGPVKGGAKPEIEFTMKDKSRIIGSIDDYSLTVETDYGKLTVPVKELVSVELGDPDKFVTREMTFVGKLSTSTIEVKSKIGNFNLDRDKVELVKVVLDETGTTVVSGGEVKPGQWTEIFNGKDLAGWTSWGKGIKKVEGGTIHLTEDSGLEYQSMPDVSNVLVAAKVQINQLTGPGAGVKLTVRNSEAGTYFVHFDGKNGAIFRYDKNTNQSTSLKNFQADAARDGWHYMQFGIVDTMMLAYVNGKPVAEVTVDIKDALPAGKITIGVWNTDANFRDIQVKPFK